MFHLYNNKIAPVPVDVDGLDPYQLPAEFKLAYVTPGCHFPTMVVMPADRLRRLIEKARAVRAFVIEDDYEIGLVGHVELTPHLNFSMKTGRLSTLLACQKRFRPAFVWGLS